MIRSIERIFTPPGAEDFRKHLYPRTQPPLDTDALFLDLLIGKDREILKAITDGDWSLVIYYRDREAYLASFREEQSNGATNLHIVQLQGINSKAGYRVTSGMNVLSIIIEQVDDLISHPENPYTVLGMPPVAFVQGVIDASDTAIARYEEVARRLRLSPSENNNLLVRRLK